MTKNEIIISLRTESRFLNICKNIARRDLAEDLLQEVIIILFDSKNLVEINDRGKLPQYFAKVARNEYNCGQSQNSAFYQKYHHQDTYIEPFEIPEPTDDKVNQYECIDLEIENLDFYKKKLIEANIVFKSQRKLSKKTGISRHEISKTINDIKKTICLKCPQ